MVEDNSRIKDKIQNQGLRSLFVYVGTYTNGESEGIYICKFDISSGELKQVGVAKDVDNPSFLVIDAENQRLYTVNELLNYKGRPGGSVSAFAIQPSSGELSLINQQYSHGAAPCYLAVDRAGCYLLVVNYLGGNVAVMPLDKDGRLGEPVDMVPHSGSSLHPERQEGPHPHSIVLDSTGAYAFVPDLGLDKVMQYRLDHDNGRLFANQQPWVEVKPGSGPRHMVFHPNNKQAFVINELSSTISGYGYDHIQGALKIYQTISTLPREYSGTNIAADLHLTPDGKFLYGSNRGHDSIAIFGIDEETGWLARIDNISTQGSWPRGFAIDPSGSFLLVANQNSDNIVVFWIDKEQGTIYPTGYKLQIPSPVCLKFMLLRTS